MKKIEHPPSAVKAWANYRKVLNLTEVGRRIGMSGVGVFNWPVVPAKRLGAVAKATGIPRDVLRPDLVGAPDYDPFTLLSTKETSK